MLGLEPVSHLAVHTPEVTRPAGQPGPHVTWLWLPGGLDSPERAGIADRRLLFDEMGRWLGAYMYGQVRDQLL